MEHVRKQRSGGGADAPGPGMRGSDGTGRTRPDGRAARGRSPKGVAAAAPRDLTGGQGRRPAELSDPAQWSPRRDARPKLIRACAVSYSYRAVCNCGGCTTVLFSRLRDV
jgi:hypothetical protein